MPGYCQFRRTPHWGRATVLLDDFLVFIFELESLGEL